MIAPATPIGSLRAMEAETLIGKGNTLLTMAIQVVRQVGIEVETAGGIADVPQCFGQWLAVVTHLKLGKLVLTLANTIGDGAQNRRTLGSGHLRPGAFIKSAARGVYRQVDILRGGRRNLCDDRLVARINRVKGAAVLWAYPLAVDIELVIGFHTRSPKKAKRLALKGVKSWAGVRPATMSAMSRPVVAPKVRPSWPCPKARIYVGEPAAAINDRFGVRKKRTIADAVLNVVQSQLGKDFSCLLENDVGAFEIRFGVRAGELDGAANLQAPGHRA